MNAPPWPMNPAVGEWFQNWVWNGARWVCSRSSGIRVLTTTFTASGPYQPSPGLTSLTVECVGGGGGGGGVKVETATNAFGGGGGGAGGYSRKTLPAALVLGGVNVTVGTAGLGVNAAPGGNGGATSFGAFCIANGGSGGQVNDIAQQANDQGFGGGGVGGLLAGAVGDLVSGGAGGGEGSYETASAGATTGVYGGIGGNGPWGGGAPVLSGVGQGEFAYAQDGQGPGAGGSGGAVNMLVQSIAGGNGSNGVCVVTEYCWSDSASDGEDCMNPPIEVNARVAVTHVPWPGPGPCPPGWGQGGYIESDE